LPETTNIEVIAKTSAINSAISNLVKLAPVISGETAKSITTTTATISWTTDHLANARVVYDRVSHSSLGSDANYGYAFSSFTWNTTPKTLSHSIVITDLAPGTTYYYRTISQGSPTQVGPEMTFTTVASAPAETVEPVATPAPSTSVAPQQAQAAEPTVTNSNANDNSGVIKGDETQNNTTEKINWTPWIVLFVLIILAGAATGGYFYWFAGEDEVSAVVKEPKKEAKTEKIVTSSKINRSDNKKPVKKAKRW